MDVRKDHELVEASHDTYPGWPPKPDWIPEQLQDDANSDYTDMQAPHYSRMISIMDTSSSFSSEKEEAV